MILANVIFPTFIAPYVMMMFVPFIGLWILVSESVVALITNKNKNKKKSVWGILIGNICSSILGALVGMALSLIPGEANDLESKNVTFYLILSYVAYFLVSVLAEGIFLKLISRKKKDLNIWSTAWICNIVSYLGILVAWITKII